MKIRHTLTILTACFAAGCSTYVNIPSRSEDVASHDPNKPTVVQVEVAAARAALSDRAFDQQFQVMLPAGTLPITYDKALPRISPHAVWSTQGVHEGDPVLEVREIRIRGAKAEVDVIRPWDPREPGGYQQLVTVELSWDAAAGWQPDRLVAWRTSPEKALRTSPLEPTPEISR